MLQNLQTALELISNNHNLSEEEKAKMIALLKDVDKKNTITEFKLERTEKVKKTTATLLEETIEELKQKRKAVEAQNRKLEIETALEKVRAIALSMKEPADMLEVCTVIAAELNKLGVKEIRNVQTAIFYESKGTYMNYEYYAKHNKTFITETSYTDHEMHQAFADQMLKGSGEFFERFISQPELPGWIAYQKTTNVFIDTYLEDATSLSYYWFSLGPVALGISTYISLSKEEIILFKRFRNVFELAYRRFIDIEKAIAQAKEAQIELALERVRARTMAMQKSEELTEAALLLFEQLQSLGAVLWSCGFNIWEKGKTECTSFIARGGKMLAPVKLFLNENSVLELFKESKQKGEEFSFIELSGEDCKSVFGYVAKQRKLQTGDDVFLSAVTMPSFQITHLVNFSYGNLMFITLEPHTEFHDIFKRFGKVFEQTYTRFLDLQKAEAQTRESQIELGLERVRARAMAMQNSDELNELIGSVFTELTKLDLILTRCVILIYEGNEKGVRWWMANSETPSTPMNFFVKYANMPFFNEYLKGWYNRELKWQYCLEDENKIKTDGFLFNETELSLLPDFVIEGMKAPDRVYLNASFNNFGNLTLATLEPLSEEHFNILLRFAKVFDLTYTRFNDLKQAEAQVREAQIQLALERVRARTMAMQHSDELKSAATLLFQQAKTLGIPAYSCGYNIWEENEKVFTSWMSTQDGTDINAVLNISLTEDANFIRFAESRKKGEPFFVLELRGERMQEHYRYLKTIPEFKAYFDYAISAGFALPETQIHHIANFSHGNLLFITLEPCPEFHDVFKRFAAVFNQTYTRFLDLQKAEAQSRESQIQLALERVRARTMAMHNSSELLPAAELLFDQLKQLGAELQGVAFAICDKNSIMVQKWTSIGVFSHPYNIEPGEQRMYEAWKNGEEFYEEIYEGERQKKYYEAFMQIPAFRQGLQKFIDSGQPIPTWQKNHAVTFKYGYLLFITTKPFNETEIFLRFGKVFEQTYTRFLDLQKAEAQARESEIELALERVRARTMAMQKSTELKEVIQLVYEQFVHLNIHIEHTGFLIDYKARDDMHIWLADHHLAPSEVTIPYFDSPPNNSIKNAKEKGQDFFSYHLNFEEKNKFYRDLFKFIPGVPEETLEYYFNCVALAGSGVLLENIGLYIENFSGTPYSDEENAVLMRFGKVFQQTYTRFLDLQKAEAQTRESQIQLALERVRARTMAMQKSDELTDTAALLFSQFKNLGYQPDRITIGIMQEEKRVLDLWATNGEAGEPRQFYQLPLNEPHVLAKCVKAWKEQKRSLVLDLYGQPLKEYTEFWKSLGATQDARSTIDQVVFNFAFFSKGYLGFISFEHVPPQTIELLERFAGVFDLTYTRFLDLEKAEAQARESQIQLALERVRARTMAMQKSDELSDAVYLLFQQFRELGENPDQATIGVINENEKVIEYWVTMYGQPINKVFKFSIDELNVTNKIYNAWKENKKSLVIDLSGNALLEFMTYRAAKGGAIVNPDEKRRIINVAFFSKGLLNVQSKEERSEESIKLLERFASVFEQTYTRFLDLQKAEAQAREAQIEAALERVRSRTMAMHNSADVGETVAALFDELKKLGIETIRCGIGIMHPSKDMEVWTAKPDAEGKVDLVIGWLNMNLHPLLQGAFKGWSDKEESFSYELKDDDLINYFNAVNSYDAYPVNYDIASLPKEIFHNDFYFSEGTLFAFSLEKLSEEKKKIFKRFSAVFGQTYRRYLDLQKAEAQAKEAQIEASLERVRSRAMAMQTSEELGALIGTVFTELTKLDLQLTRCVIWIFDVQTNGATWWMANSEDPQNPINCEVPYNAYEPYLIFLEQWKKKTIKFQYELKGKIKKDWDKYLFNKTGLSRLPDFVIAGMKAPECVLLTASFNNFGAVNLASLQPLSDKHADIMLRFAKVFDLTYTRFNDLKQAEASTKEAKIEAALERVRGKAMAMHSSKDLAETIHVFYREIELLSVTPRRCGVGLLNKESRVCKLSTMTTTEEGESVEVIGKLDLQGHPVLDGIYNNWLNQKEYHPVLRGNEIKEYYKLIRPQISYPDYPTDAIQYGYFFFFPQGGVFAWTEKELLKDELQIYHRFTSVLSLAYKRCHELQQAEANAREAVKQSALDRIRADIASMRTISDLNRITPLIWNELIILGIPFIRCGVFIMNDEQQLIHTFLSTPDGKAIAAFHIPYDTPGNIKHVINHWRENKNYIDHWDEDAFTTFAKTLVEQGALTSAEQYLKTIPHGGFYLHFLPFLQGMLYVGNTTQLSEDEINLIQSLADAFSTAYARYEDFNKLEAAKKQVDITLTELQATQKQLIQSEKMASLGELTAGIAHEIQNPLNFVNNFSEVSKELIDEMRIALEIGNKEEAVQIANDIIQNLEKINHHGKRAGDIVKGMLQHSRKSSGAKEPTDISALTDEYLRLSYHGLRAKDKNFNADFETDFDEAAGKINIISQDIGRVILNLINNAFYAVNEKKKLNIDGYKPTISVQTKKINDKVEIRVSDNGNGIPPNIIDKIFQPFFTTKPTGEGTGLGLSLSYDIIKAHGGEIRVDTNEGEGSKFIILLPVS